MTGQAVGEKIGAGRVRVVRDAEALKTVEAGDVLVTEMTDPDWEPVMKRVAALVTDQGGRTRTRPSSPVSSGCPASWARATRPASCATAMKLRSAAPKDRRATSTPDASPSKSNADAAGGCLKRAHG